MSERLAEELRRRGIRDEPVLAAIAAVPRRAFLPAEEQRFADEDRPLPIGGGQTTSQPWLVAHMTSLLELHGGERVLEVGTGTGYQTAILARLCRALHSVELSPQLSARAAECLASIGAGPVELRVGDGGLGWPEHAPYDAILVAAAAPAVPPALLDQLAPGGRLVIPVGPPHGCQRLLRLRRRPDGGISEEELDDVRFVPLRGAAGHALV